MSKLKIRHLGAAESTVEVLYEDLTRRLAVGPVSNCPVEQCRAFVEVCLSESCGKCVPCRLGLRQMSRMLGKVLDGEGSRGDLKELVSLAEVVRDSADCAIGYEAAMSVFKSIENFERDFEEHIERGRCSAKFEPVPCKGGCPAHVDIPGYIALTKDKRYADAVRLIRYDNPFPSVCALICEHPCESRCRRQMVDDAINIRAIKRMAVDNAGVVPAPVALPDTGRRIAVIGSGPSGLTAAYYLRLMGHNVTVYEQRERLGGMMRYGIPRYRLPDSYLDSDVEAILSTGVEAKTNVSIGQEEYEKLLAEYDAVYIAIGAHNANRLGIEGEDAENVLSPVELLRDMGDGKPRDFTGKRVVVVGGGNVAMDCTRTAVRLGASEVKCVYRRRQVDMTALPEEVEGAAAESCEIITMMAPVRVEKDAEGRVAALIVQPQMPGAYDRGRPRPVKADLPEVRIECDVIISAIGQAIDSAPFEAAGVRTRRGRFITDDGCRVDGDAVVYAGGDCQSGPSTVIRAVEAGKTAAANISEALGYDISLSRDIDIPYAPASASDPCGRINLSERSASERKNDFDIMERAMTEQECLHECSRCLRCDHHGYGALKGGRASW